MASGARHRDIDVLLVTKTNQGSPETKIIISQQCQGHLDSTVGETHTIRETDTGSVKIYPDDKKNLQPSNINLPYQNVLSANSQQVCPTSRIIYDRVTVTEHNTISDMQLIDRAPASLLDHSDHFVPTPAPSCVKQIRFHEENGAIQRFPPGTVINFGLDLDTFSQANIPDDVVLLVEQGAIQALEAINKERLGVTFAYVPHSRANVFNIHYSRDLQAIAEAFFPSELHHSSVVRVSPRAIRHVDDMANILAHEFMHVLGMRHWNAGSDDTEKQARSLRWPGTEDDDRRTIMLTGPPPSRLRFGPEDFRSVRELYAKANGAVVEGRTIQDVVVPSQSGTCGGDKLV